MEKSSEVTIKNNKQDVLKRPWYKDSVVYQIYPWSFKDANGDGIGDLKGITSKLDYLNDGTEQSLGVGAIWLSPIYTSPMKDYGYDISNYYDIDPRFGTLADFDELVREAHARGIRVIMDYVTSHSSSEHPWFKESISSKNNSKRDWYVWQDPKRDGSEPNNWLSVFGGSAWQFDEASGQYYLHHFLKEQPDLNWRNPEVREEMKKVLRFWMDHGVDGFRVDALSHFIEDAEFRDNPVNEKYVEGKDNPYMKFEHRYNVDQPELREVVEMLCETLNDYEGKFVVSEIYSTLEKIVDVYKYSHIKIHAPFNFNLINMKWSAEAHRQFIDEFERLLDKDEVPTYVLGNHDQSRIATRRDTLRARLSAMLLLTLRGLPFVYYGEELGLVDSKIPREKLRDTMSIQAIVGQENTRDPARTPMPWNSDTHAGFSTTEDETWLPVADTYKEKNVETETADPQSMLNLYKKLIHLRNGSNVLLEGTYRSCVTESKNIFAYIREYKHKKILVVLNFSDVNVTEHFPGIGTLQREITTHMDLADHGDMLIDNECMTLRPFEGIVFTLEN